MGSYSYSGHTGTSFANPHAVTDIAGTSYTYDNNGNLTSDETWTHSWGYNNRLIASADGSTNISYAYDHEGNRVEYTAGGISTYYPNRYYILTVAEL